MINNFSYDDNLLLQVRSSCREVAEKSRLVRLNLDRLKAYASRLHIDEEKLPSPDPSCHFLGHGDDTVAFFLTLDSINFGSGYFPYIRKKNGMSGYFTIASFLNDYFSKHGPLTAEILAGITAEDCVEIFHQDPGCRSAVELMGLFTDALNSLGEFLISRFNGSFIDLVKSAGFSAEALVRILIQMKYFDDTATYHGKTVKFFKRAQITAADLYLAFKGQGPGRFDDIDGLTIFADNLVPHVLRLDGILNFDGELLSHIENGMEIMPGSPEEVEIRACSVHAVELIVREMRSWGKKVNSMLIDQFLWNRGQLPRFRNYPRHRTRSIFY